MEEGKEGGGEEGRRGATRENERELKVVLGVWGIGQPNIFSSAPHTPRKKSQRTEAKESGVRVFLAFLKLRAGRGPSPVQFLFGWEGRANVFGLSYRPLRRVSADNMREPTVLKSLS